MKNTKRIEMLKTQIKNIRNSNQTIKIQKEQIAEIKELIVELQWDQVSVEDYARLDLWILRIA